MSTNKTEHLNLHQWESTDRFHREEFNENFQKVDAGVKAAETKAATALAALAARTPKVAVGTYQGTDSIDVPTVVNVGFAPQAVFIWASLTATSSSYQVNVNGMAIRGTSLGDILTVTDTGFSVVEKKDNNGNAVFPRLNRPYIYFYLAIG